MDSKKMRVGIVLFVFLLAVLLVSYMLLVDTPVERRIESVEQGLLADLSDPPRKRMNLVDRMAHYKVPGVSIAVINDYQIEWAKGYGVLEVGKDQPVTTDTIFQPGSTAKPIVAMVALHYVEAGDLELDSNVNNELVSWKVPENDFTAQTRLPCVVS